MLDPALIAAFHKEAALPAFKPRELAEKAVEKAPRAWELTHKVGLPLVGMAVSAPMMAYDTYKGWGFERDAKKMQKVLKGLDGDELVDMKKHLNDRDSTVQVITTPAEVDAAVEKELKDKPFMQDSMRMGLKQMIEQGNNAAAWRARSGDYIIGKGNLPKEVIEHELGHIHDFREKGIYGGESSEYDKGFLNRVAQHFSKKKFRKGTYAAEVNAWKKVPPSERKKIIEQAALGTYDKHFHRDRRSTVGTLGTLAALRLLTSLE